jgi:hypothetical protein
MPDEPVEGGEQTPAPGSPEDVAAKAAEADAKAAAEGDQTPKGEEGKPPEGGGDNVTLSKKEHDAAFGELRLLKEEKRKREEREADEEREAAQKKAKDEGDYEAAVELERDEKKAAQSKAQKIGVKLALSEAAEERGWSVAQRKLARKLIDVEKLDFDDEGEPTVDSMKTVLDAVAEEYPDAFTVAEPEPGDGEIEPGKKKARKAPATPPKGQKPFEGYVSPDEYMATPREVRLTPEFQGRVELSRAHWPDSVPHDSFPGGSGEA